MIEITSGKKKKFSFGFHGAKTLAYNLVLVAMKKTPDRFVDLYAGSNIVAYEVRRRFQIPVTTNDVDYHSVCISRTFLNSKKFKEPNLNVIPQYGAGSMDPKISAFFKSEVINWIDGFVKMHSEGPRYLAALGTVLRAQATYRGAMFAGDTASLLLTIPILEKAIFRFAWRKRNLIVPGPPGKSVWGTAIKFLQKTRPGGVCYIDPAWPNSDGSPALYVKFSKYLNQILSQKPTPFDFFPLNKKNVQSEILSCLRGAVKKFDQVLLATQSSNYPVFEDLNYCLQKEFNIEEIYYQRVPGRLSQHKITEYLFSIKGENK